MYTHLPLLGEFFLEEGQRVEDSEGKFADLSCSRNRDVVGGAPPSLLPLSISSLSSLSLLSLLSPLSSLSSLSLPLLSLPDVYVHVCVDTTIKAFLLIPTCVSGKRPII